MSPKLNDPDGPVHILLVEDNPADANLILETLRSNLEGQVELRLADTLYDGARCLATRGEIDVILLDLGLPDSQGLTTLLRMHALAPSIPVVVLTGWDDDEIIRWTLQAGAQAHLVKGHIDEHSLSRAIWEAAGRQQSQETGEAKP